MSAKHPARLLAQAIADAIPTLGLSRACTVRRVWIPETITHESLAGADPLVFVAPTDDDVESAARSIDLRSLPIDIAIVSAVASALPVDVDPLADFAEELLLSIPQNFILPEQPQPAVFLDRETLALADRESLATGVFFHVSRLNWSMYQ